MRVVPLGHLAAAEAGLGESDETWPSGTRIKSTTCVDDVDDARRPRYDVVGSGDIALPRGAVRTTSWLRGEAERRVRSTNRGQTATGMPPPAIGVGGV